MGPARPTARSAPPLADRLRRLAFGREQSLGERGLIALLAVALAVVLHLAVFAPGSLRAPYATFTAAVVLAAFAGGCVAALAAAALAAILVVAVAPAPLDTDDRAALLAFLFTAVLVAALTRLLRAMLRRLHAENVARTALEEQLRAAHADLERLVAARTADLAASNALLAETGRLARVGGWSQELATGAVEWTETVRQIHEVGPGFRPTAADLTAFYEPGERPRAEAALARVRTTGEPFDLELPFVTAGRTPLWVRITGQAYREGAAIRRIGGFVQDVTTRRRAEDELRLQRDRSEQLLAERTTANRRLRELDQLKSEFLATMSHEVRTPLNSIVGFTGLLLKGLAGPLTAEQHKQLGLVRTSAHHLLALVNNFFDLARLGAGHLSLQRAPFDLAEIVAAVLAELAPAATAKGIALGATGAEAPLPLVGDATRTRQILTNLVDNAVKFTAHGAVEVAVHRGPDHCAVAIRDTGIGIRPDQLPHLFEAFRQLDASAHRRHEGTGLGLHLSRKLAEALGGTIAVGSRPGEGSTFTLTLPLAPP